MAEKLSFSAPFLSDVEKGRRNPPDLDAGEEEWKRIIENLEQWKGL